MSTNDESKRLMESQELLELGKRSEPNIINEKEWNSKTTAAIQKQLSEDLTTTPTNINNNNIHTDETSNLMKAENFTLIHLNQSSSQRKSGDILRTCY